MPSRWRTRITPICDQPRAAPPPSARPIFSFERGSRSAAIWVTPSPPPPSPSPNARRAIPSHNMTILPYPVAIVAHADESLMNERQAAAFRCLPRAGNVALVNEPSTLPPGLADSHKAGAQFPSPLVGEGREGGAGHRAPGRSRPAVHQPQGQGPGDPSGLAPAADRLESLVGKVLHGRRPPPRSAFGRVGPPHKGEEEQLGQQMYECRRPRTGEGAGVRDRRLARWLRKLRRNHRFRRKGRAERHVQVRSGRGAEG